VVVDAPGERIRHSSNALVLIPKLSRRSSAVIVRHPPSEPAAAVGDRKAGKVLSAGAQVLVATNPGNCMARRELVGADPGLMTSSWEDDDEEDECFPALEARGA
jgi:hypothetical protein